LKNTRQMRIDRADLIGLGGEEVQGQVEEDEGPIPKYTRSMLKFKLSDGSNSLDAIEYRRIPQLDLGETPLGFKVSAMCFL